MTQFASESFVGLTETITLQSQSANWVKHPSAASEYIATSSGSVYNNLTTTALCYHTAAAPSADYSVSVDLVWKSSIPAQYTGVAGRINTAANTMYFARYSGTAGWQLYKSVAGTATQLGSSVAETFTSGTKNLKLVMNGTTLSLYNEGEATPVITATDSSITAAGYAGIRGGGGGSIPSTGIHITNFSADTLDAGAVTHSASGALAAQGASMAGVAARTAAKVTHSTTGTLAATAAVVVGATARSGSFITHAASAALFSSASTLSGAASRAPAAVSHATSGSLVSASSSLSGVASRAAAGQLVTDVLANNTGSPLASTSVFWSWLPIGRIGSLAGITPVDGSGTTDADGRLTVSGLSTGAGIMLVTKRNTDAEDDDVFYQAGTVV